MRSASGAHVDVDGRRLLDDHFFTVLGLLCLLLGDILLLLERVAALVLLATLLLLLLVSLAVFSILGVTALESFHFTLVVVRHEHRVGHVLVRVESAEKFLDVEVARALLEQRSLSVLEGVELSVVLSAERFHLVVHREDGHALGKVGQRIQERSFLAFRVIKRAVLSEFAIFMSEPVLARLGLVVRVHSSEGGLTDAGRKGVSRLSELVLVVRELTVVLERALTVVLDVLAHLSLVLLLQKAVVFLVVGLVVLGLRHLLHDFTRGVVEVSDSAMGVHAAALILRLRFLLLLLAFHVILRRAGGSLQGRLGSDFGFCFHLHTILKVL
mmetsp:Transcript_19969/g.30713  ORF Transcript_19969/g.30713 Transcript_19969/m.30713 type:complete len:327 (+) Transcript_19969:199-1179(+)